MANPEDAPPSEQVRGETLEQIGDWVRQAHRASDAAERRVFRWTIFAGVSCALIMIAAIVYQAIQIAPTRKIQVELEAQDRQVVLLRGEIDQAANAIDRLKRLSENAADATIDSERVAQLLTDARTELDKLKLSSGPASTDAAKIAQLLTDAKAEYEKLKAISKSASTGAAEIGQLLEDARRKGKSTADRDRSADNTPDSSPPPTRRPPVSPDPPR